MWISRFLVKICVRNRRLLCSFPSKIRSWCNLCRALLHKSFSSKASSSHWILTAGNWIPKMSSNWSKVTRLYVMKLELLQGLTSDSVPWELTCFASWTTLTYSCLYVDGRLSHYISASQCGSVLLPDISSFIEYQLCANDEPRPMSLFPWVL